MKATFKVLFYLRSNRVNKEGNSSIMIRITIDGESLQFSSKLDASPNSWDGKSARVKGKTNEARAINAEIDTIRAVLSEHYRNLFQKDGFVTPESLKNSYLGVTIKNETILTLFDSHNEEMSKLIDVAVCDKTVHRYNRTRKYLADYLIDIHNLTDIPLRQISHEFITGYENYLRIEKKLSTNTLAKDMVHFQKVVKLAMGKGWLSSNPFINYSLKKTKTNRGYLTPQELDLMVNKEITIERISQVRDIFVFSCYTGLAYIDVKNLTTDDIRPSFDGKLWIIKDRQKTSVQSAIPLMDVPLAIIEKYKNTNSKTKALLPVLSNQRMNSYLKEIADICGITKNLTYHLARHTFATTVTLSNGVPIESISKMLGHTNIRTTQIYAKITNEKVGNDMKILSDKLNAARKKQLVIS